MYYEVRDVGVLVVRASEDRVDPRGKLIPETLSLRALGLLERLADDGTAMSPPDATPDPE